MELNKLIKEKYSLLEWIEKIKENNSNDIESWNLIENIEFKIKQIENKITKLE